MLKSTQLDVYNWWRGNGSVLSILHARRGWGKTWFFLTIALEEMARNPGARIVYAAPSREMAKQIVIPTVHLIIPHDLPDDIRPEWRADRHAIVHPNGAFCVVEGADDDRGKHLRGPFANLVLMDEMAFWRHPDFVYRSVLFPQAERRQGRMLGASTSPESPQHEFSTVLIPEAVSQGAYVKRTLDDDKTLTQNAKDAIAAQYDKANHDPEIGRQSTQYRREYNCEIVTESERAVVPEFVAEYHVGVSERPEFYDGYTVLDLGMVDLSHALFSFYDYDAATIVVEDEYVKQYTTVSEMAPLLLAKERQLWGTQVPRKRVSDAQPISLAEFSRQHLLQPQLVPREMRFAAAENREPEALINRMRSLFDANRIRINPRCTNLIAQLAGGLWNERRTDFERMPGLGHLDGVLALAYTVDSIDYGYNPASRKKYDRERFGGDFTSHSDKQKRYGNLSKMMPSSVRRGSR